MEFKSIIIQNLSKFTFAELEEIKEEINKQIDLEGLRYKSIEIWKNRGKLEAIKYIKVRTGWEFKQIFDFIDK